MTGPEGQDLKATLGIMESTLALLREPGVTHLAASFDTVIESFRNVMFPAYKSSVGMDPDLLAQFPVAEEALEALGVVVWRNIEFEADDAIATAAVRWVEDVDQVVIVTPDKDMNQLVIGDRIVTYNRREQKFLDEAAVVEKFGIHPESIPDYLALVGDTADGVPGLPGWGAKSAAAVLARYPRLELIPESASDWGVAVRGGEKLAAVLREALRRPEPSRVRIDRDGRRLLQPELPSHAEVVGLAFDELRQAAAAHPTVCTYLLEAMLMVDEGVPPGVTARADVKGRRPPLVLDPGHRLQPVGRPLEEPRQLPGHLFGRLAGDPRALDLESVVSDVDRVGDADPGADVLERAPAHDRETPPGTREPGQNRPAGGGQRGRRRVLGDLDQRAVEVERH